MGAAHRDLWSGADDSARCVEVDVALILAGAAERLDPEPASRASCDVCALLRPADDMITDGGR
jgi:hypothetical protein